ncbi:uncharacterized protein EV422DRAFT_530788 [Fimicolochytrium jonesii]|uniref:uncharacterized protein n=1 Tax=Fimicolochytrium jonesii TaxID=1396493 RepID=UPI0022FF0D5F|nr:uncharacterized protein EV422DRAFT_530788 [Fimicolochytrium jonesii]KAI8820407.1 hypothetical protein EV422DRAFT_530788 [Fimicolochytrium jonesii]
MGNGSSRLQPTSKQLTIDQICLKDATDSITLHFPSTPDNTSTVQVSAQQTPKGTFKLASLIDDPDPANPTQWKSVQSLARLSAAGINRLKGRDLTLTIDYSDVLEADVTFRIAGEAPRGLVFLNAESAAERQHLMSRANELASGAPSPSVIFPELRPRDDAKDGVQYLDWHWRYEAPLTSGKGDVKSELLPPTGGWKNFCCIGECVPDTKHFRALLVFEFFISSVTAPFLRQSSQGSTMTIDSAFHRRPSSAGLFDNSPLSAPGQEHEPGSGVSPLSAQSSFSSPVILSPSLPAHHHHPQNGAPPTATAVTLQQHRRELSSTSAGSMTNLEEVDDEPAFRHTLETLEKKTSALKLAVKKTRKDLLGYMDAGRAFVQTGNELIEGIGHITIVDPTVVNVLNDVSSVVERQMDVMLQQVENLLLVQFDAVYDRIKETERQKKIFEQDLKEFNSSEHKYLSINKTQKGKLSDVDMKWQEKKKTYELKRLDYYCHLKDLHGLHTGRIVDMQLIMLGEKQLTFYKSISEKLAKKSDELSTLSEKWKVNDRPNEERREREERRKLIESKAQSYVEGGVGFDAALSDQEDEATAKFKGIRDLSQTNDPELALMGRRRKGYLWVGNAGDHRLPHGQPKGGPGGQLKKMWCVLQKGHLKEYNLKRNHPEETHSTNLRLCSIRSSTNVDRRFSFELINGATGTRRLYQATDAEDMKAWMAVLQNSIQAQITGIRSEIENFAPDHVVAPGEQGLLEVMREADPGNSVCAECGMQNPEWMSINLGCVICLECSGVHRNLGTHITKIRSLTLDQTSWTPELIAVLKTIGNTRFNSIWEASLSPPPTQSTPSSPVSQPNDTKPTPKDPRDVKEAFIRNKYILRKYVDRTITEDAYELLDRGIDTRDVLVMLKAVACGANVANVPNEGAVVVRALGYPAAPAPPPPPRESSIPVGGRNVSGGNQPVPVQIPPISISQPSSDNMVPIPASPTKSTTPSGSSVAARFKAAEFLIQNGADINAINHFLSPAAVQDPTPLSTDKSVEAGGSGVDTTTLVGKAAIHYAAMFRDVEAVAFLVRKGCDVFMKDAQNKLPIDLINANSVPSTDPTPWATTSSSSSTTTGTTITTTQQQPNANLAALAAELDAAQMCETKIRAAMEKGRG